MLLQALPALEGNPFTELPDSLGNLENLKDRVRNRFHDTDRLA
eukprot:COSAG01_NODE_3914_length_5542_cov_47.046298_2_plen_43_part_00